jgi:DNA invertase Pin-like site-specific DNA recombinase
MIYGYARVSTGSQSEAAQVAALKKNGRERCSAKWPKATRPTGRSFGACSTSSKPATCLMVTRLDRLARSTRDLLNTLAAITGTQAGFRSLADTWADTTTPHGRLMLTILGGLAEFEKELIRPHQ